MSFITLEQEEACQSAHTHLRAELHPLHLKLDLCSEREELGRVQNHFLSQFFIVTSSWQNLSQNQKREVEKWRKTDEEKDQTLLSGGLWHFSSSPISLQLPGMLGVTTRDSGKDRRRAYLKYKQHLCICVWGRWDSTCIHAPVFQIVFLLIIVLALIQHCTHFVFLQVTRRNNFNRD